MPRSGTLVVCVHNLDYSGANQVVLNIIAGRMHESNVVILSPIIGAFAGELLRFYARQKTHTMQNLVVARFIDSGAAVRIGNITNLLIEIRDVFCIICNTIMTADIVVDFWRRSLPTVWIMHEWWTEQMIVDNLALRNIDTLTPSIVQDALTKASMIVFVCEAQRQLYNPTAPSNVIYVGVPSPLRQPMDAVSPVSTVAKRRLGCFTLLCLGIVCPRKNQVFAVEVFKRLAKDRQDVRLLVVGARYSRKYEAEYVDRVKAAMGNDPRIELHDVTDNVNQFYEVADCLFFTSTNEVTPMVISEAMSWGIPVVSTNIAGIPEMMTDGVEGFMFSPNDSDAALQRLTQLSDDPELCKTMGSAGKVRFASTFDLDIMVDKYRQLLLAVAPPIILVDMDGTLVDWDQGFRSIWGDRSKIDRQRSYSMEHCVPLGHYKDAMAVMMSKGFFECLPPMEGGLEALREMEEAGLRVYLCSAPLMTSQYCVQEKVNWVRIHLGQKWLSRLILCEDKAVVRGDLLVDDKPLDRLAPEGYHTTATWKQVIFDAPYNRGERVPRLRKWKHWRAVIMPLLGKSRVKTNPANNDFDSGSIDTADIVITEDEDPYLRAFGSPVALIEKLQSPRVRRDSGRRQARKVAQQMQEMFLSTGQSKSAHPGDLSPEEIASIAGTGSLFVEDADLEAMSAHAKDSDNENETCKRSESESLCLVEKRKTLNWGELKRSSGGMQPMNKSEADNSDRALSPPARVNSSQIGLGLGHMSVDIDVPLDCQDVMDVCTVRSQPLAAKPKSDLHLRKGTPRASLFSLMAASTASPKASALPSEAPHIEPSLDPFEASSTTSPFLSPPFHDRADETLVATDGRDHPYYQRNVRTSAKVTFSPYKTTCIDIAAPIESAPLFIDTSPSLTLNQRQSPHLHGLVPGLGTVGDATYSFDHKLASKAPGTCPAVLSDCKPNVMNENENLTSQCSSMLDNGRLDPLHSAPLRDFAAKRFAVGLMARHHLTAPPSGPASRSSLPAPNAAAYAYPSVDPASLAQSLSPSTWDDMKSALGCISSAPPTPPASPASPIVPIAPASYDSYI